MITEVEKLLQKDPYSMGREEKEKMLDKNISALTRHHDAACPKYHAFLKNMGMDAAVLGSYYELFPLPVV